MATTARALLKGGHRQVQFKPHPVNRLPKLSKAAVEIQKSMTWARTSRANRFQASLLEKSTESIVFGGVAGATPPTTISWMNCEDDEMKEVR